MIRKAYHTPCCKVPFQLVFSDYKDGEEFTIVCPACEKTVTIKVPEDEEDEA